VGGRPVAGSDVSAVELADPDDLARFDLTPKTIEVVRRAMELHTGTVDSRPVGGRQ
jgi:hypothetical protein